MLAPAVDDPSLLEPLVAGRPDLRAQDVYARSHEWAVTDEDVLRRRTTGWLAGVTRSGLTGEPPRAATPVYIDPCHLATTG